MPQERFSTHSDIVIEATRLYGGTTAALSQWLGKYRKTRLGNVVCTVNKSGKKRDRKLCGYWFIDIWYSIHIDRSRHPLSRPLCFTIINYDRFLSDLSYPWPFKKRERKKKKNKPGMKFFCHRGKQGCPKKDDFLRI